MPGEITTKNAKILCNSIYWWNNTARFTYINSSADCYAYPYAYVLCIIIWSLAWIMHAFVLCHTTYAKIVDKLILAIILELWKIRFTFHYRIEVVWVLLFNLQPPHAYKNIEFQYGAICTHRSKIYSKP